MAAPGTGEDRKAGFVYALSAYLLWGILPIYMKALALVPPVEVVAHRVIWALPVAGAVIVLTRRTADLRAALRSWRTMALAAMTAVLISVNWGIYVWAIGAGQALDAALGYYINPLFSIALGAAILGERLSRLQWAAVGLAALAVAVLTWEAGRLPWVALGLTVSWGLYAYFKKRLAIGPNQGFFLEVLILTPVALAVIGWLTVTGQGHMFAGVPSDTALLLGAGLITAVPLILYANGAKLLRLSTIGILQYVTPTLVFLVAVLVFREPFGGARLVAFPMIWAALALYSFELVRQSRTTRRIAAQAAN